MRRLIHLVKSQSLAAIISSAGTSTSIACHGYIITRSSGMYCAASIESNED